MYEYVPTYKFSHTGINWEYIKHIFILPALRNLLNLSKLWNDRHSVCIFLRPTWQRTPEITGIFYLSYFSLGSKAKLRLGRLHETFRFLQLLDLGQLVGLPGRVISSSQGLYRYTNKRNAHRTP
jgi:hypothetical protein